MTSFAKTALLNPTPFAPPGRLSLPDTVRRILPHARYSKFLETLVVGSHPSDTSARKTTCLPVQDRVPFTNTTTRSSGHCLCTGAFGPEKDLHASSSYPDDLVFRLLYKAHGKYAWMNGRKIEDVRTLQSLGEGAMSSAHIKSGRVETAHRGGRESVAFNYVCKTWDMSKMGQWNGFYSELALYKSARYLLSLQGDVVPNVMGVYTRPGKIDIVMGLPHSVFWMEASASMPVVLKDRVVEAFQKLHDRGVLHGDVALRHILIGADARVTLIDFQASRADEPNEDLGLHAVYPGEKEFEMRRVKFLLNMDNARKKEVRKSKSALRRSVRNGERERRRQELLRHGITVGLPSDEPEPLDDIKNPPVPLDELEKYWMEDANDDPRRIVVPGSSDSDVAGAVDSFLQCIRDIEGADCGWSVVCNGPSSPRSPLSSPFPFPDRDKGRGIELPQSIKSRDFAYEKTCRPSISCPKAKRDVENHDPSSAEEGTVSGNGAIISSHDRNSLKRHHEDPEEKAVYPEKLPTGKRARLDSPLSKERDDATATEAMTETKPVSGDCFVEVHSRNQESITPRVSGGCRGRSPVNVPESKHLKRKRPRAVGESDGIGEQVNPKKCRDSETNSRCTSTPSMARGIKQNG